VESELIRISRKINGGKVGVRIQRWDGDRQQSAVGNRVDLDEVPRALIV
jgi:hypothetical protein